MPGMTTATREHIQTAIKQAVESGETYADIVCMVLEMAADHTQSVRRDTIYVPPRTVRLPE